MGYELNDHMEVVDPRACETGSRKGRFTGFTFLDNPFKSSNRKGVLLL